MGLNGTISPVFAQLPSLQKLLLAENNLTVPIPAALTSLSSLKEPDVSDNTISGAVPAFGSNVLVNTAGNRDIGKNVSTTPVGPRSSAALVSGNGSVPTGATSVDGSVSEKSSLPSLGVIIGLVLGVICGVALIGFMGLYFYKRRQHPMARVQSPNTTTVVHPSHSGSDPDVVKVSVAGSSLNGGPMAASETYSQTSSGPRDVDVVEAGNMVISVQVLRNVTNNFSEDNILGWGGFGTVYKGELHDGTKIAVKRMEAGVMGTKGLNEFKSEIAVLTKVRHRNLVSLLGYCLDGNEMLLVYEYMPQGTLSRN